MTVKDTDDGLLGARPDFGVPPPPSPDLLQAVEGMKAVPTRSRWGAFAVVALVGVIAPAIALLRVPIRQDMGGLPVAWVILAAILWAASSVLALVAALVPRRQDVLPAPGRASAIASTVLAFMFLFALFATVDVPGLSVPTGDARPSLLQSCVHCIGVVFKISIVFLLVGSLALRRLVPVGGLRVGLALGAAGGAMGGLLLHFICPVAGTAHVVLGHVGGMMLSAAAGALVVGAVIGRAR